MFAVLCQMSNFSAISWWEQVIVQWDVDDACEFVLDQQTELNVYSASSMKQKSAGRHILAVFIKFMKINCNLFLNSEPQRNIKEIHHK